MNDKNAGDINPGDAAAIDLVAFGIIIDDIVFPDGRTSMGILGGGGPQTAFGMRLWSRSVGLAADICITDRDFIIDWLRENQIDPGGIRVSDLPTPRAWQVMEEDGRRTQVWRVPENVIGAQLDRYLDKLPLNYQQARGLHFGVHPDAFHHSGDVEFIQCLRQQGAVVSIECFKPAERAPQPDALQRLVSSAEIFSANQEEAQSLVGECDPFEQARRLAKAGGNEPVTQAIVVRLGAAGSVVMHVATRESLLIPAFPTQVVDPIGAGNAYCGGFLSGWVYKKDLRLAAIWGAVSASFTVEQIGLPRLSPDILLESRRREALLHKLGEEKK